MALMERLADAMRQKEVALSSIKQVEAERDRAVKVGLQSLVAAELITNRILSA